MKNTSNKISLIILLLAAVVTPCLGDTTLTNDPSPAPTDVEIRKVEIQTTSSIGEDGAVVLTETDTDPRATYSKIKKWIAEHFVFDFEESQSEESPNPKVSVYRKNDDGQNLYTLEKLTLDCHTDTDFSLSDCQAVIFEYVQEQSIHYSAVHGKRTVLRSHLEKGTDSANREKQLSIFDSRSQCLFDRAYPEHLAKCPQQSLSPSYTQEQNQLVIDRMKELTLKLTEKQNSYSAYFDNFVESTEDVVVQCEEARDLTKEFRDELKAAIDESMETRCDIYTGVNMKAYLMAKMQSDVYSVMSKELTHPNPHSFQNPQRNAELQINAKKAEITATILASLRSLYGLPILPIKLRKTNATYLHQGDWWAREFKVKSFSETLESPTLKEFFRVRFPFSDDNQAKLFTVSTSVLASPIIATKEIDITFHEMAMNDSGISFVNTNFWNSNEFVMPYTEATLVELSDSSLDSDCESYPHSNRSMAVTLRGAQGIYNVVPDVKGVEIINPTYTAYLDRYSILQSIKVFGIPKVAKATKRTEAPAPAKLRVDGEEEEVKPFHIFTLTPKIVEETKE